MTSVDVGGVSAQCAADESCKMKVHRGAMQRVGGWGGVTPVERGGRLLPSAVSIGCNVVVQRDILAGNRMLGN